MFLDIILTSSNTGFSFSLLHFLQMPENLFLSLAALQRFLLLSFVTIFARTLGIISLRQRLAVLCDISFLKKFQRTRNMSTSFHWSGRQAPIALKLNETPFLTNVAHSETVVKKKIKSIYLCEKMHLLSIRRCHQQLLESLIDLGGPLLPARNGNSRF